MGVLRAFRGSRETDPLEHREAVTGRKPGLQAAPTHWPLENDDPSVKDLALRALKRYSELPLVVSGG